MREIWINGEFVQAMADDVVQRLLALDKESNDPIKIYINSPGGDVRAMFSIIDTRMVLKSPVYTINYGQASSAAAALFASGDKRFITENAQVMIHEAWGVALGNADEVKEQSETLRELTDKYVRLLAQYTGQKEEKIKQDIDGKDLWLDAEEAINYGAADMVLTEKIKEKYRLQSKPVATVQQKPKTEVKNMNRKELLALLKSEHDIDVEAMSAQLSQAKGDLAAAAKVKAELEAELSASRQETEKTKAQLSKMIDQLEADKKERCFEGLVKAMKEIPARKETVMAQFQDAEAMEAFYKDMPARLNTQALGDNGKAGPSEDLEFKAKLKKYHLEEEEGK